MSVTGKKRMQKTKMGYTEKRAMAFGTFFAMSLGSVSPKRKVKMATTMEEIIDIVVLSI